MKLLRLKLGVPFRSLAAGFEVHFLREWDRDRFDEFHPYCLAGRNGSGKSNVLEALAAIFYHIECVYLEYRPDGFEFDDQTNPNGFQAELCNPDAFELEYLIPDNAAKRGDVIATYKGHLVAHIRITKEAGKRPVIRYSVAFQDSDEPGEELTRQEVKSYLPKYVIGYSSGHNEILSLPFFKMRFIHFDEYRDKLAKGDFYGTPEGRMIYVDDQFSQAILICHFLFPSAAVTKVFEEKVGIKGIRRFRIIIRRHHRIAIAAERLQPMTAEELKDETKTTVELTSKLTSKVPGQYDVRKQLQPALIDKLIMCSTAYYEDFSAYPDDESCDLYLDYWVNEATKRAFQVLFGEASGGSEEFNKARSALNLFQGFQTLLTMNYYKVDDATKAELYQSASLYVNETIPAPASHERITRFKEGELIKEKVTDGLYVKALSDGEHQLLHTIGLCLLYRHESALFLLDEPETHLNPDWRASYISTLRAALDADGSSSQVSRELLLTSHSPFIISDCGKDYVLVFNKDVASQLVNWQRPDFETFGASVNAITMKVFGHTETIGDYAMARIMDLRQRLETGEDPDQLIKEVDNELGDSVEKVIFVNQALIKKEGK
jgi:restriction system-associated AAA family ATPase